MIICKFTRPGVIKVSGKKLQPTVRQLIFEFFETETFRSKYLFELNTEELRFELGNDFQWYLMTNCVKDARVTDVSMSEKTNVLTITLEGCESIYTVEEMLKYIKERVQHPPHWGGSGYRILDENCGGGVSDSFDCQELLFDLDRLEKLIEKSKENPDG